MAAVIPSKILGLQGQCVKRVVRNEAGGGLVLHCDRDRRFVPVDHRAGSRGTVNRRLRRQIRDLPMRGHPVTLSIEDCQLKIGAVDQRMERLSFVEPGHGVTRRFARFVSQLARHMSISALALHTGLAWRTVKAMDERALRRDLPALVPGALTGLRHLVNSPKPRAWRPCAASSACCVGIARASATTPGIPLQRLALTADM